MTLIHTRTEKLLQAYIAKPGKPLLIIGDEAHGLQDVLKMLRDHLLNDVNKQNVLYIQGETDTKAIAVDQIRETQKQIHTKQSSDLQVSRIIIIDCKNGISDEAQQAFLKTLEEPPHGILICLAAPTQSLLRKTIISRCQQVSLLPISLKEARTYANTHHFDETTAQQNYYMSSGASSLFESLMNNRDTEIAHAVQTAKAFLHLSVFERLKQQKSYDSKEALANLIDSLLTITSGAMKFSRESSVEWQRKQRVLLPIKEDVSAQVTTKLLFLKLCLELRE